MGLATPGRNGPRAQWKIRNSRSYRIQPLVQWALRPSPEWPCDAGSKRATRHRPLPPTVNIQTREAIESDVEIDRVGSGHPASALLVPRRKVVVPHSGWGTGGVLEIRNSRSYRNACVSPTRHAPQSCCATLRLGHGRRVGDAELEKL